MIKNQTIEKPKKLQFHIISMATYGQGLSGSDRIFIELFKRIGDKYKVHVYLWEQGLAIAKREGLKRVKFVLWSAKKWAKFGFFINYFARIIIGIINVMRLKFKNSESTIIYSATEFWQDSIPTFILKIRFPKITWIASWYQTAPNPFKGFSEEGETHLIPDFRAFLYWFVQQPIQPIIKKYADFVFVTSEPDKRHFPRQNTRGNVVVIKGGVDTEKAAYFQKEFSKLPKIYDAVFQGRFHPQKGVVELIDIWRKVTEKKPDSKLAMIGDGPLMESVKLKVKSEKLEKNVMLFGYVFDGPKKYKIFSQSRVVVHPAFYDSGGMAAAEAMAFGLPGVSFDLSSLKTYYPKGMLKVSIGNLSKFSETVLRLLDDERLYQNTKQDALRLIKNYWSWNSLAERLITMVKFVN